MSARRVRRDSRVGGSVNPPAVPALDRQEVARFLRPQPPIEVPRRAVAATMPGLIAGEVLGYRVIRRLD